MHRAEMETTIRIMSRTYSICCSSRFVNVLDGMQVLSCYFMVLTLFSVDHMRMYVYTAFIEYTCADTCIYIFIYIYVYMYVRTHVCMYR